MNIRLKLFMTIGSILIVIAILSYYLPKVVLKDDINSIRDTFNKLIVSHQDDDWQERKSDFLNRIQGLAFQLNAHLYFVYDSPHYRKALNPALNKNQSSIWRDAVHYMSYNPEIGFLQISAPDEDTKCIVIDNAEIFSAEAKPISDNIYFIEFESDSNQRQGEKSQSFIGTKINIKNPQSTPSYSDQLLFGDQAGILTPSYFYLYRLESLFKIPFPTNATFLKKPLSVDAPSQKINPSYPHYASQLKGSTWKALNPRTLSANTALSGITGVRSFTLDPQIAYTTASMAERYQEREIGRIIRRDLVVTLIDNLPTEFPLDPKAPVGIAELIPSEKQRKPNKGFALLSRDIFFNKALFADAHYYQKFGHDGKAPIASKTSLIDNFILDKVYVGNTLNLSTGDALQQKKYSLLTIASSIKPLLEDLAASSELVVFLTDAIGVRIAFDGEGKPVPSVYFSQFPVQEMLKSQDRTVTVAGIPYDFFKIQPVNDVNTYVLIIVPQADEILYTFKNNMTDAMLSVTDTITYQLLAVNILCLGIGLIILGFISGRITRPIILLAKATEEVSKGHYSEINIPIRQERHDEIAVLTRSFSDMINGLRDRERIRGILNKVVSKEIAEEILKGNIHLGGEEKIITIFFSDIRQFSKMTEHLPPQEVISFLNAYMTKMSDIIEIEGGVIDKYVGDEIMALYGAPLSTDNHAIRAIRTALTMIDTLRDWNAELIFKKLPPVEIGVGIHTGNVVAGNMGAENRLNYTVLGANVNLASRLCFAAAPMQILITEATLYAPYVLATFEVEELSPMQFKGFSEAVRTYSVTGYKKDTHLNDSETHEGN